MIADLESFVVLAPPPRPADRQRHLVARVNTYLLTVECPCRVVFQRWVSHKTRMRIRLVGSVKTSAGGDLRSGRGSLARTTVDQLSLTRDCVAGVRGAESALTHCGLPGEHS